MIAPQEYRGLWGDKFMHNGEGFLLVYSITDQTSFEEVGPLRTRIVRVKDSEKVPSVIIGNKCDLKVSENACGLGRRPCRAPGVLRRLISVPLALLDHRVFFSTLCMCVRS